MRMQIYIFLQKQNISIENIHRSLVLDSF